MKLIQNRRSLYLTEEGDHGNWSVSYGDLITILLSFFIIFFSTDFKAGEREQINQSLVESLRGTLFDSAPMSEFEVSEEISIKKINKDNFLVFFKNTSFFNSGDIQPNQEFDKKMKVFVQRINPFLGQFKLVIHAYTDSTPVKKKKRYHDNVELSGLRSISVKSRLEKLGVETERMEISGKGILSESVLKFMGINLEDKEKVRAMQRTVAYVVKRDWVNGEQYEN